jgi:3-deoxy-D-manno-octulosonate 8-phosphate phosphatase (KDO 8-P phosphatase)
MTEPAIDARARHVRFVLLDVDGVLTDGTVHISDDGTEAKSFSIRDGAAIIWAQRAGLPVGLLSGRPSGATSRRAEELGIRVVSQDGPDKAGAFARILEAEAIESAEVAYMGDDLLDLPILSRVGLAAAPADAVEVVRGSVHWVSRSPGGKGAVREFLELVLRATGRWDGIVARFRT